MKRKYVWKNKNIDTDNSAFIFEKATIIILRLLITHEKKKKIDVWKS